MRPAALLACLAVALTCGCGTLRPLETKVKVPVKDAAKAMLRAAAGGYSNGTGVMNDGRWALVALRPGADAMDGELLRAGDGERRTCHWIYAQSEMYFGDMLGMHEYFFSSGPHSVAYNIVYYHWPLDRKEDAMQFARALHALQAADPGEIAAAYGAHATDRDEP